MTSLKNKDDVLTLLVHLGYLAYDIDKKEAYIPNEEIRQEFIRAIKNGKRQELVKVLEKFQYHGEVLLVGISYQTKTGKHECKIRKI